MSGPEFIAFVCGGLVGLLFSIGAHAKASREDYHHAIRMHKAQTLCKALTDTDICTRLARHLEIEEDGGVPCGEFVEQAIRNCWQEVDEGNIGDRWRSRKHPHGEVVK